MSDLVTFLSINYILVDSINLKILFFFLAMGRAMIDKSQKNLIDKHIFIAGTSGSGSGSKRKRRETSQHPNPR